MTLNISKNTNDNKLTGETKNIQNAVLESPWRKCVLVFKNAY